MPSPADRSRTKRPGSRFGQSGVLGGFVRRTAKGAGAFVSGTLTARGLSGFSKGGITDCEAPARVRHRPPMIRHSVGRFRRTVSCW